MKRSLTSPHSPGPQPVTLSTASRADDAVHVSHRQELSTSSSHCCCSEPELDPALLILLIESRCSRLAEHTLHPGAVAARLGSKQRPRAARAEAARAWRWWPWHDSNGVTLFVQQYDRGTCCELLLYKYLVPGTWYAWSPYMYTKKMKCLFLPRAARKIQHSYKEVQE